MHAEAENAAEFVDGWIAVEVEIGFRCAADHGFKGAVGQYVPVGRLCEIRFGTALSTPAPRRLW